jgi:hypothetical protein
LVHGNSPLRTLSMNGPYLPRQASANASQSASMPLPRPKAAASRITEPRQSTTVPNTSNNRASIPAPFA